MTFRTWANDLTRTMDLNEVNIKDIPCSDTSMAQLISLGQEQMPNAAGIKEFNDDPFADRMDHGSRGTEAAPVEDETFEVNLVETIPAETTPSFDPKGGNE
jgi:hypothetical protein